VNILIFKLSPVGDTVMFLPVVQTLRRLYPDARITVFTTPASAALFRDSVPAGDLIQIESETLKRCWRRPWQLLKWCGFVRRIRPDAVLLSLDQSSVARFLGWISGARIRAGGDHTVVRWRGGLTHTVPKEAAQTLAEWDWSIARAMMTALGRTWPQELHAPTMPVRSAALPRSGARRVVIHAGGSTEYRRWLPDRFAALASALARDCEVVWIEHSTISLPAPSGVRVVAPRSLEELIEVIADSDLFVGNHSGPFHLAAALGRPCVVLAGATITACDPPWNIERFQVLRAPGLACLPCDRFMQAANACQNSADPMACMKYWKVETVEAICRDRLDRATTRGPEK
jgi:ADP-heptose:LPS heptosyltransferase